MTEDHQHEDRGPFDHDPIGHAEARAGMTVDDLVAGYREAGAGAGNLAEAVDVAESLFSEDVTTLFGLAGAMVPLGMRSIVAELIRDGHVDALVTTGATLTHDTIEAIGGHHHHGAVGPDGEESRAHDEALRDAEVDRIYDVYLPQEQFAAFEAHCREHVFEPLTGGDPVSIEDVTAALGRANSRVNDEEDIDADAGVAAAAHEAGVPIYCPAIQDSILGLQTWMYGRTRDLTVDAFADLTTITDQAHHADELGAFVVGGGVPKNFVLQAALVTPRAYDYAVQLTMDPPETGGLTGATLDEARSWGKLEPDAENVSVYADATITLPLVVAAARERLA
ncbi:deoxyhypusine synthase [Halococcoides cellulosivorans]|uniref:Deoxyhypusine synthase n=1 Tax=Halococcoides cellulosivorans TaxID=1679096 RepID=A0A2R4WXX6_9EURY|nr:deoxyhypusine synthase [Halococcoides cellulosivorans]AWB26394.1 deoxyhypusine synthase [Halococcoides cellulosivorans]